MRSHRVQPKTCVSAKHNRLRETYWATPDNDAHSLFLGFGSIAFEKSEGVSRNGVPGRYDVGHEDHEIDRHPFGGFK